MVVVIVEIFLLSMILLFIVGGILFLKTPIRSPPRRKKLVPRRSKAGYIRIRAPGETEPPRKKRHLTREEKMRELFPESVLRDSDNGSVARRLKKERARKSREFLELSPLHFHEHPAERRPVHQEKSKPRIEYWWEREKRENTMDMDAVRAKNIERLKQRVASKIPDGLLYPKREETTPEIRESEPPSPVAREEPAMLPEPQRGEAPTEVEKTEEHPTLVRAPHQEPEDRDEEIDFVEAFNRFIGAEPSEKPRERERRVDTEPKKNKKSSEEEGEWPTLSFFDEE